MCVCVYVCLCVFFFVYIHIEYFRSIGFDQVFPSRDEPRIVPLLKVCLCVCVVIYIYILDAKLSIQVTFADPVVRVRSVISLSKSDRISFEAITFPSCQMLPGYSILR